MYVENISLFHIHRTNQYDEIWNVGRVIETPSSGYSQFFDGLLSRANPPISINMSQDFEIKYLSEQIDKFYKLESENVESMTKDAIMDYASHLLHLLDGVFDSLLYSRKVARELLYERVRIKLNPSLPSRLKCTWLCEREDVSTWISDFSGVKNSWIFKVKATGNIFQADGSHIKIDTLRLSDFECDAENYWRGEPSKGKILPEILFEGKIEIIKKYSNLDEFLRVD